jgi:hypothetical protein
MKSKVPFVLLLLALITTGCVAVTDGAVLPHEDPSSARSQFNLASLFLLMGDVLDSLATGDYGLAGDLLAYVDIESAHIPDTLRHICGRYVGLCGELTGTLDSLESALSQVELSLQTNDVMDARVELTECWNLVEVADEELSTLEEATDEVLLAVMRHGSAAAPARMAEARSRLEQALVRLRELTRLYEERLKATAEDVETRSVLVAPSLELAAEGDSVWVGEAIDVFGSLSAASEAMSGREIELFVNEVFAERIVSGSDGSFRTSFVPFEYESSADIQARYAPRGADMGLFQTAESEVIVLTVRFYESSLEFDAPAELHPGRTAELDGTVRSLGAVKGRIVEVRLDDVVAGQTLTEESGRFDYTLRVPADMEEGEHRLLVAVKEDDSRKTAPCSQSAAVKVVRVSPEFVIACPEVVIVPGWLAFSRRDDSPGAAGGELWLSGTVRSTLPIESPRISVRWNDEVTTVEVAEGEFEVAVPYPESLWMMGRCSIQVEVLPDEPWHRPAAVELWFHVVNLLVYGAAALVFWGLLFWLVLASRRRLVNVQPGRSESAPVAAGRVARRGRLVDGGPLSTTEPYRRLVVHLYETVVAFLVSSSGIVRRPSTTLREFLAASRGAVGHAWRLLAELTGLAEEALYSRREFRRRDSAQARWLALGVRRETGGRPPRGRRVGGGPAAGAEGSEESA